MKKTTKENIEFIESKGKFGMRLGLDSIRALLEELGNPQNQLKFIHVAGSNGKGSVCRILEASLTEGGFKTGAYTSPALENFSERIRINQTPIDEKSLNSIFEEVNGACVRMVEKGLPHPTGFEIETAMALLHFLREGCEICIMEVGLGGRLDATNIIPTPLVSVITHISLEHTKYLGDTLSQVAGEKAAIIKDGTSLVIEPQEPEALETILAYANERDIRDLKVIDPRGIRVVDDSLKGQTLEIETESGAEVYRLNLLGDFQQDNAAAALEALRMLEALGYGVSDKALKKALSEVTFPGRFEILKESPHIIIDGAHNVDGVAHFVKNMRRYFKDKSISLFFGMIKEKDVDRCLDLLTELADDIYLLTPDSPDAYTSEELAGIIKRNYGINALPLESYEDINDYIDLSNKDKVYAFTGSLYMIGKARGVLRKIKKTPKLP